MSVLLSPKVSLDFELEQGYQAPSKVSGIKTSSSYLLPSLTIGATYSFNASTAIAISGSAAGSGAAPDSSFRISLWKKF
ncbi:MAG: nucleoid-structuring protein H-NS [Helicobacter sp.]|nr:nucleoid-structuring protein H-NS [Helicobacter sp.]